MHRDVPASSGRTPGTAKSSTRNRLDGIYRPIGREMGLFREEVRALWREVRGLLPEGGDQALDPGGKLLRPAMCLLSAGALDAVQTDRFIGLAAAIELLHTASLTHDDVVDQAQLRRGRASMNASWDNQTAVLVGDFMVAKALDRVADLGDLELLRHMIRTVQTMAQGELLSEVEASGSDDAETRCLKLAFRKTACLFGATCASPAYLLAVGKRESLQEYGESLGMAFQLADDVLDLRQNSGVMGKDACNDLAENRDTLAVLYLSQALNGADRARFDGLRGTKLTPSDCEWVAQMMAETGTDHRVLDCAQTYADKAKETLGVLEHSPYRDSMAQLADFVVHRQA